MLHLLSIYLLGCFRHWAMNLALQSCYSCGKGPLTPDNQFSITHLIWLPSRLGLQNILTAFLQSGKTPTPNECSGYDTKQSDGEVPVTMELQGMQSTPSFPLLPGSLWLRVVALDRVLSMGQIELNHILMLNWIAWNRTVLIFKKHTYAKLHCLKWNCFWMLNWIVQNRTVFDIETVLTLNWII